MDPKLKKFLDGLKAKGLNDKQISRLASLQGDKKKWGSTLKKQINTVGRQAAASQGALTRRIERGNPGYRSNARKPGRGGVNIKNQIGDRLSRNNPNSIPNEIANDVDKVGRGIKRGADAVFGAGPTRKPGESQAANRKRAEAIRRRQERRKRQNSSPRAFVPGAGGN